MVRIVFFIFIFIYPFHLFSNELTSQEKIIFSFVDLNKDENISIEELDKLVQLIFQLLDVNRDGRISELEIIELKNIINSLS